MARQALTAYASGTMTISGTAILISNATLAFSAAELAAADEAVVTAHAQPLNLLTDGTAPTATYGISVGAEANYTIVGNTNIQAAQFIKQGATDATISVVLYKLGGV